MEGYWQGKFSTLKVIGDKRGDVDAMYLYSKSPENFSELYKHLSADVFQIPIRVMVEVRNPYDIIASNLLYAKFKFEWKKTNASVFLEDKKCMVHHLDVFRVFGRAQLIQRIRKELNLTVLEILSAELVHMPRQTINRICQFLGVECYKEYIHKCEENKAVAAYSTSTAMA